MASACRIIASLGPRRAATHPPERRRRWRRRSEDINRAPRAPACRISPTGRSAPRRAAPRWWCRNPPRGAAVAGGPPGGPPGAVSTTARPARCPAAASTFLASRGGWAERMTGAFGMSAPRGARKRQRPSPEWAETASPARFAEGERGAGRRHRYVEINIMDRLLSVVRSMIDKIIELSRAVVNEGLLWGKYSLGAASIRTPKRPSCHVARELRPPLTQWFSQKK